MSQLTRVELARQGDLQAIAELMTWALRSQRITARTSRQDSQLHILLEAETLPNQEVLGKYVYQSITKLNIPQYKKLVIYGKNLHQNKPHWRQDFSLNFQTKPALPESIKTAGDIGKAQSQDLSQFVFVGRTQPSASKENNARTNAGKCLTEPRPQTNTRGSSGQLVHSVKSLEQLGQVIFVILWVAVAFNILFLIYSLVWAASGVVYLFLGTADTTGLFFSLLQEIVQLIYKFWESFELADRMISYVIEFGAAIWLHCLHTVLKWSFKSYPIRPWGAVARYVIPFYNIWGIWNIFATLANYLNHDREKTVAGWGEKLKQWLWYLYGGLITSMLVNFIYQILLSGMGGRDNLPWWFYAVLNITSLVYSLLFLQVIRISHRAVLAQAHQLIQSSR